MLSLPFIGPQDAHELWFGAPHHRRNLSPQQSSPDAPTHHSNRRNNAQNPASHRGFLPSRAPNTTLASLQAEERALRVRKNNIASFGYSWIRPAGCAKTMLGMKEEEAEREEALAALAAEQEAAAAGGLDPDDVGMTMGEEGEEEEGMERDLDDDIPEAEEGLVEEGEEGLEEDGLGDEEGYMERDLDDDIPEGYPEDDYEDESGLYEEEVDEDFDNLPDLDADVPEAAGSEDLSRDLDDDIPDAAEDGSEQEGEWQHTDTEDELDDEDENEDHNPGSMTRPRMENFRTSTPNSRGLPPPPFMRRDVQGETEAQRRFINRWSGGGDAFDSSSMMFEEDDLRASMTSQGSRRSGFGRHYPRRVGGPRDSLN
ncbi:uncharacterized protein N7496_010330 [Penicillium cataractarum]|uniref:Anaphase-promoting complex, subunit 15/MND2 n=1 Tax=Penicillium cataractarum TaxID=2100454 RepID=A0A9W9V0S7_9EURO|nr:uncharacterized protein N7496_010330 [Penicillium cataractarum]KAJ5364617.1 hypothetical protein N7496_010330 [Penicillium cataractarum]